MVEAVDRVSDTSTDGFINEEPSIDLNFPYGAPDSEETELYTVRLPVTVAWDVVEVIQEIGYQRALTFANFATVVANIGHSDTPYPYGDETIKVQVAIGMLSRMFGQRLDSLEDRVLAFTYQLLRIGLMSRKTAADFAAVKLKKGKVDTTWPEAYRKRVDRWAVSHHLPQVGKSRKPKKGFEGIKEG